MKKTLEFQAKLDTSEFDSQVNRLQQRVTNLYRQGSGEGTISGIRQAASAAGISGAQSPGNMNQQVRQSVRELDQFAQKQYEQAEKINRALQARERQLERLRKMNQDDLNVQKEIERVERSRSNLQDMMARRGNAMQNAIDAQAALDPSGIARLRNAYQSGGIRGAMTAGFRMAGGALGIGASAVGMVGTAAQGIRTISQDPRIASQAQASFAQNTSGQFLGDINRGRGSDFYFYQAERQRALQMAMQESRGDRAATGLTGIGALGALGIGIGGLLTGGLGLLAGGALALGGGATLLGNREARLSAMGTLGSGTASNQLKMIQDARMMENMTNNLEAEKLKDPTKALARERYFENFQRDLTLQRRLGVTSDEFYGSSQVIGGERIRTPGLIMGAGQFTTDQMISSMSGLLDAGSSSTQAQRQALFNNQAQRMGIANSTQMLGGLNRVGTQDAQRSLTEAIAAGFQIGLSKDNTIQELNKFVELGTKIIVERGENTAGGQRALMQELAQYTGSAPSIARIEAAGGAMQFGREMAQDKQGIAAVEFMRQIDTDETLGGLSARQKLMLFNARGNMTANSPEVQRLARETGMSPEQISSRVNELNQESAGGAVGRQAIDKARAMMSTEGAAAAEDYLASELGLIQGSRFTNMTGEERRSFARAQLSGQGALTPEAIKAAEAAAGKTDTGRVQDAENLAMARQSEVVADAFVKMRGAMEQAAIATSKMSDQFIENMMRMSEAAKMFGQDPEKYKQLIESGALKSLAPATNYEYSFGGVRREIPMAPPAGSKPESQ